MNAVKGLARIRIHDVARGLICADLVQLPLGSTVKADARIM